MDPTSDNITTYQIIKDIVIPGLGVLSTLIIGIVIAVLLKRREEKAKIKSLLIDDYMQYLNKRTKFVEHESLYFTYEILKDIYINYGNYFEDHANRHMPQNELKKYRDSFKDKLDSLNPDDSNWSPFTYRFCFLLGTKIYYKKAQNLENNIVSKILDNSARNNIVSDLKKIIKNDKEIIENMNALNLHKIVNGLDMIVRLISNEYNNYQIEIFKPYDNMIADLVDKK